MVLSPGTDVMSRNFRHLARLDLPGAGQVRVEGNHAYIGHMNPPHGTTIVDVGDPRSPRVVTTLMLDDPYSHTHKVRVTGDLMVVNYEQVNRHFLRRAEGLDETVRALEKRLGHAPADDEVAQELGVPAAGLPELREAARRGYHDGGFRVYDIADKANPRLLCHKRTHGFGSHRFDLDSRYAYISTEMPGFVGNILVVYDLADPSRPEEVSRWWMPDQENADNARPTWKDYGRRLHHTMRRGDLLWAGCWEAGIRVIDASDIRNLKTVGAYEYHPPFPAPTHTAVHLPFRLGGREIAVVVDEEHKHRHGQQPANLWIFDVSDLSDMKMLSSFHVSELDSPWANGGARFGAHQFQEVITSPIVFVTWFSGGLRAVDISDPLRPVEAGHFIPQPAAGQDSPQSNDVFVDERGLVYLADRLCGLDILEFVPG